MSNLVVGKPIAKKNFIENILINGHSYQVYTDNRTKSSRIDIHNYNIGDLHKPWYFYGDKKMKEMPNHNTNNISLIYDIKDQVFDLSNTKIGFTSFKYTPKSKGMENLIDVLSK